MKCFKGIMLLLLATTIFSISAISQTVQNGVVMEYRMWNKKKPLGGVEIDVKYAGSTYSDKKGNFSLKFNTLKPGEKVTVNQIEKAGYEVFNLDAVNQWNLSRDGRPFTIIMARSKDMMALRDNYSSQSSKNYKRQRERETARLNQMLAEGKIMEKEHQKQLKELEDWYSQKTGNINSYVDHFVRFDLSELSTEETEIIKLVQQGNFDEAIKRYDILDPSGKYKQCVQNINEMDNAIHVMIDAKEQEKKRKDSVFDVNLRRIDVLRMAGGRDNFEKIGIILKEMALTDTTDLRCIYTYADYLSEQKSYDDALRYYRISLNLTNDSLTISQIMGKIGLLELELGHFNESQDALSTSRNILQDLSNRNQSYTKHYAQSINNLALLYAQMRKFDLAEDHYLQAQMQYQKAENEGDSCTLEILTLKNDLGRLYLDMRDFKKAQNALSSAYSSIKAPHLASPKVYSPLMAEMECDLGVVNKWYLKYDEAEKHYLSSLSIYQDLYYNNPEAYRKNMAKIAGELSLFYEKTKNSQQAEKYSLITNEYYDTLLMVSSDAVLPAIARMQKSQVDFYFEKRNFSIIEPIIENTYQNIYKLYNKYPNVYRSDLCDILGIMGQNYAIHRRITDAKLCFEKAKHVSDTLCEENPFTYSFQRIKALNNLAIISAMMNLLEEDGIYSKMAYDECKTLFQSNPEVYAPDMAMMADNLSIHHIQTNDYTNAKRYSSESERLYSELFDKYPLVFGKSYIGTLNHAAIICRDLNDSIAYESCIIRAYQLSKELYRNDPTSYGELFVKCLDEIATHLMSKDVDQSLAYRLEGLEIISEMYKKEPDVYVKTMGRMYLTTSYSYKYANDARKAFSMIDSAMVVYKPFFEQEPDAFRMPVATCYFTKGRIAEDLIGDADLVMDCFMKALPLYQHEFDIAVANRQEEIAKDYLDYLRYIHLSLYDIYKDRKSYLEAINQLKELSILLPEDEEIKQEIMDLENKMKNN